MGLALILLLLGLLALKAKITLHRWEHKEIATSPLSQALTELAAVAGGIYVALVLLTSFLKLEVPETVEWGAWRWIPWPCWPWWLPSSSL